VLNEVENEHLPRLLSNTHILRKKERMSKTLTLGQFLSEILDARHLTARALAEGANVSQSGISNVLQGRPREPDPRTLRAIADYLEIDVFILFRLLGYVPPASEYYGAYSPIALYVATRFEALPDDKQQALLHVMETLAPEPGQKQDLQTLRERLEAGSSELDDIDKALPEMINDAANYYLTRGEFLSVTAINPKAHEFVSPTQRFGDLSVAARERLVALMRHKIRQISAPYMVDEEYR